MVRTGDALTHSQSFTYQKRQLEAIASRRLESTAPIAAITERFSFLKSSTPSAPKKPSHAPKAASMADLMLTLSSAAMMQPTLSSKPKLPTASTASLDNYIVRDGKVLRRKMDYDQLEALKHKPRKFISYLSFEGMKELDRTNRQLKKKLISVKKQEKAQCAALELPVQPQRRTLTAKSATAGHRTAHINVLEYNKSAVCNITSDNAVPRSDVSWKRSIVKSPFTVDTSQWSSCDPKLLNTTVSSQTLKTRFWLQERVDDSTANVYVRYPYCRECVRTAMPIKVQLEKSWGS